METDNIKLLKECNAGTKMAIDALEDVIPHTKDVRLKERLLESKAVHSQIGSKSRQELMKYQEEGKEPASIAKMMSWMKTNIKLTAEDSDRVAADLITDGCNMGVKSLYRYMHEYSTADETTKNLTNKLIKEEENLAQYLTKYL